MSKPQPDAVMTGPDGVDYQSVNIGRSRPFARACIEQWKKLDGKDRSHLLGQNAMWVPVAVIETVEGAEDVDVDELKTSLRTRLTAYEIPVEIHRVDALPRSVSLKVDRRRLLEMVDEIESSRAR